MDYDYLDTEVGRVLLAGDELGLRAILFPGARAEPDWRRRPRGFADVKQQLIEYFAGERRDFDLELAPSGTRFQLAVWKALRKIPYGETISYGELARRVRAFDPWPGTRTTLPDGRASRLDNAAVSLVAAHAFGMQKGVKLPQRRQPPRRGGRRQPALVHCRQIGADVVRIGLVGGVAAGAGESGEGGEVAAVGLHRLAGGTALGVHHLQEGFDVMAAAWRRGTLSARSGHWGPGSRSRPWAAPDR